MIKICCWEFNKCGREPGGRNAVKMGVCPASIDARLDGINGGINGGRACWSIPGTMCDGKITDTFSAKMGACLDCKFYKRVMKEEQESFQSTLEIWTLLKT